MSWAPLIVHQTQSWATYCSIHFSCLLLFVCVCAAGCFSIFHLNACASTIPQIHMCIHGIRIRIRILSLTISLFLQIRVLKITGWRDHKSTAAQTAQTFGTWPHQRWRCRNNSSNKKKRQNRNEKRKRVHADKLTVAFSLHFLRGIGYEKWRHQRRKWPHTFGLASNRELKHEREQTDSKKYTHTIGGVD